MRYFLITLCLILSHSLYADQVTDREGIEDALRKYKNLDVTPQLILLEGILEKCEELFPAMDTTTTKVLVELSQWHFNAKEFKIAIEYCDKLTDRFTQLGEPLSLARIYNYKGNCYVRLHNRKKGKLCYEESVRLNNKADKQIEFDAYKELAGILYTQGNYNLQVDYAKYALSLASTPEEKCEAYYQMFRGNIWLRNKAECVRIIDEHITLAKQHNLQYQRGMAYFNLAWLRSLERKHHEAIKYNDKAISFFKSSDAEDRHRRISYCYKDMGIDYEKLGFKDMSSKNEKLNKKTEKSKYSDLAIQYAKLALKELKKESGKEYHPDMGSHYHNLAVRYMRLGDYESGIRQEQNAIKCYLDDPEFTDVRQAIPKEKMYSVAAIKWILLTSIQDKALCYAHLYVTHKNKEDAVNAERHIANALELVDIMREELSTDDTKIFWRTKTRKLYDYAIEICDWLGDEEKMMKYMEKSRSIMLLDELNHKDALSLIPSNLANREQQLRKDLSNTSNKDVSKYANYNSFLDSLKIAYPNYYEYKFQIKTPTISEVQKAILTDSSQVIQYYLTPDSMYIHSITKYGTELITSPRPVFLKEKVGRMMSLVGNKDSLEFQHLHEEFVNIASDLHELLYARLDRKMKTAIIIPDDVLNFLPFDLLVNKVSDDGQPEYLIQDHTFSTAPSLSVLMKLTDNNRFDNLLLVSPQDFDAVGLSPLITSEDEIRKLQKLSRTQVLQGEAATLHNFVQSQSGFDVIHFSSHSGVDSMSKPWIALNDSLIELDEIYKLNLEASMVILSSCKSTQGDFSPPENIKINYTKGQTAATRASEGINSLARAFLFADASAVVGSNWDLNEASGLEVLELFYQNIKSGKSKAEALRAAKLSYLEDNEYKSPFYWAPFALIGNPQALYSSSNESHFGLILAFLLAMVLLFAFSRKVF